MAITIGTDAYTDLAGAEAYMRRISTTRKAAWSAAVDADKEAALMEASLVIDRQQLRSVPTTTTQALAFPRAGETEIPTAVANAVCEQALYVVQLNAADIRREKRMMQGVIGGSIGDANEYSDQRNVAGRQRESFLCPGAREWLRTWLVGTVAIS